MRLNVLCLWHKHGIVYLSHIRASNISRAYWTSWIVNANLYSCDPLLFLFFPFFSFKMFALHMQCIHILHNKEQIILWDLCLSIASFFFVQALCHWRFFISFSFYCSLALDRNHCVTPIIIHSLADNQHRHIHNSCVSFNSHFISPG